MTKADRKLPRPIICANPSKPQSRAEKEAFAELLQLEMDLQDVMKDHWLDKSLPQEWHYLDAKDPIAPKKTKVTLRLDDDMLRWFRRLGPGYQSRINQVLRIYWKAVLSGKVARHYDAEQAGPTFR